MARSRSGVRAASRPELVSSGWESSRSGSQSSAGCQPSRVFNIREGWQPADDWLPERLLSQPLETSSGRLAALTPERLRAMISGYYAARGLDAAGRPARADIAGLGLR